LARFMEMIGVDADEHINTAPMELQTLFRTVGVTPLNLCRPSPITNPILWTDDRDGALCSPDDHSQHHCSRTGRH
jgi:hypothetical protein